MTAVHHRSNPILTNALMADYPSCEQSGFFSIIRSAKIWDDLDKLGVPGIHGVYSPSRRRRRFRHDGDQPRAALRRSRGAGAGARGPGAGRRLLHEVDHRGRRGRRPDRHGPGHLGDGSRCNPIDDIDILRNTWSTWLDPTQNPPEKRPYGSKALINACKEHRHLPVFSKRTTLRKEIYDKVAGAGRSLDCRGKSPPCGRSRRRKKSSITKSAALSRAKQPGEENKK